MSVLGALAALLTAAGVVAAALGILTPPRSRTRTRAALAAMLDLWTAASLLQLAGEPRWSTVGMAAILVALRILLRAGLAHPAG